MLLRMYFSFSKFFFKNFAKVRNIGKGAQLRLNGRVIGGQYVSLKDKVIISENWLIAVYPEFGGSENPVKRNSKGVVIEEGVSVNRNLTIYCAESVKIGKNCMLGSNILITDNDHGMNPELGSYDIQPLVTKETMIEQECWIAQNCCILAGSHIGRNSIIGAGSVVKGNIPPYSIAVGSPAKVVRTWDFERHAWSRDGI